MSLRRPRSLVLSLLVCVLLVGVCVSGYSTKTWEGSTTCDENAAHAYQQHQVNNNCVSSSALAGVNSVKVVCNTPKLTTSTYTDSNCQTLQSSFDQVAGTCTATGSGSYFIDCNHAFATSAISLGAIAILAAIATQLQRMV